MGHCSSRGEVPGWYDGCFTDDRSSCTWDDRSSCTWDGKCARGAVASSSKRVPPYYVVRWIEPSNTIAVTIEADGTFHYRFASMETKRLVSGWRDPPQTSELGWAEFGSRGTYRIQSLTENTIALDGVVTLTRDTNWEEQMLRLDANLEATRARTTSHNRLWEEKEKERASKRGASWPFPGKLPPS